MPTIIENLFVAIRADSKGLDSDLKGVLGKFKKLEDVGKNLSRKLSLPILALSGVVLKMAGDFESAMNVVAAKSGATGVEFQKLQDLAAKLGATTRFSATQAAQGMAFLAQAGFNTNQILAALPATLNLASAGGLELARAADIASNVLKGFRLPAEQAGRAADVLALSAAKTNTDVEELGAAMSRIAPVAADLGVSMEETAAAIGTLSDAGIKGFRAGTALRAIMAKLAGPTGQAAKAMEKLGISTRDLEGNFVGLPALMDQFAEAERNAADKGQFFADKVKIFGTEMVSSAGILINKGGPALQALTEEFEKAGGASQRMTDIMERGFVGGTRVLISALESLAISIGNTGLLKFAEDMTRGAAEFVRGVATMNKGVLALGVTVAGIAAAVPILILAVGLIGPAFITGAAAVTAAGVSMVAAVGTFSLAVSAGLLGALTAAEIALGALGVAVIGAAAAFAAFKLGQWAADNIPLVGRLGDALADVIQKASRAVLGIDLVKSITGVNAAMSSLEFTTAALEKRLAAWGVTVERGDMTLIEYSAALRKAGTESGIVMTKTDALGDSVAKVGSNIELAGKKIKSFGEKLADAIQGLKDQAANSKLAAIAQQEYAVAIANSGQAIEDSEPARFALEKSLERIAKQQTELTTAAKVATEAVNSQGASLKQLGGVFDQVLPKMSAAEALIGSLGEQLRRNVEQAELYAAAQAILTERIAMGGEAGREAAEMLGLLNEKMGENVDVSADTSDAMQAVSTAVDDLSKKFADLLLGTAELGDVLKQLAQTIIRTIVEGAFKQLLDAMVLQDNAVKKLTASWKSFLGIFGGGKGKTPSVPGDVPTGGGGAGGGAGGLLAGPLGVITAIGSLASQIFGNFQLARIEGSLNKIELNTRETTRALTGAPELLAQSAQMIGQAAGQISDATQQGFVIPSATNAFNDPSTFVPTNTTPTPFPPAPGLPLGPPGPEAGAGAAPGPRQGLGVLQVLFEQSDFMQDQLGQLKFQTDSLDTLKDQAGRREGLLETIRDSLSGIGNVGFGGAVVTALLGEINEALRDGSDLIKEVRNTVAAVRQHFVFARDIAEVTRDRQLRVQEDILKELKMIAARPAPVASISEFVQAQFRSQLNSGEAIP